MKPKLVEAINVISDFCKEHGICRNCPFAVKTDGYICLLADTPDTWPDFGKEDK